VAEGARHVDDRAALPRSGASAAAASRLGAVRFVATSSLTRAAVTSASGIAVNTPALLTSTSSRRHRASASATIADPAPSVTQVGRERHDRRVLTGGLGQCVRPPPHREHVGPGAAKAARRPADAGTRPGDEYDPYPMRAADPWPGTGT